MTSTLPSPSAGQEREPAPSNNLPEWDDCALRVANSDFFAKNVAEGGYGPDSDAKLATELHRFIYEYDDADSYRSAWFLHRLELLLDETRRAALTSACKQEGGEPSDEEAAQPFYDLAWKNGARRTVSFAGDELESVSFGPAEFEAFCAALSAPQPPLAGAGEALDRQALIDWAAGCWHAEVAKRPLVNVHRRSLDDTWRQVLRHLGVDDRARLGPTHDELLSANPKPAPLNGGCGDGESEAERVPDCVNQCQRPEGAICTRGCKIGAETRGAA